MEAAPAWELSKENVQPIKRGRDVARLDAALTARPLGGDAATAAADQRAAKRSDFEARAAAAIAAGDFTGALAIWKSCIEWVKAEWPAGGAEAGLVPLLERATRSLVGCAGMGGHTEYVKLWITYADALPDPSDVFKYMHAQRIGADCALFYMAWAWLAEHRGNVAFADKVYARGLARGATPTDRLVARYREFKRRAYRKWRTHVAAAEAAGAPVVAGQPPQAVRAASLPERWSDDIDFHALVDLDALSRAAAAAGGPPAGGSSSDNVPQPRGGGGATADPLAAGMGALPPVPGGGGAPRAALGTIAESSAVRSYRQPAPQQTPAEFEASLPASTRNVLAAMAPAAPVAAGPPTANFARSQQPQAQQQQQQQQLQRAALGGAAAARSASTGSNSNVPIAIYSDFDDAPPPPAAQPARAALGGASSSGSGLSARPAPAARADTAAPASEPAAEGGAVDSVGVSRAVASSWRQLPSQADGRKENSQAPSKWTEAAALPSSGGSSVFPTVGARPAPTAARDSRVAVWVDEELSAGATAAAPLPAAPAPPPARASTAASRPAAAPPAPTAMRLRELELPPQAPLAAPAQSLMQSATQRRVAPVPAPAAAPAAASRGGPSALPPPPAELAPFLAADMADEEAWSCEERRAQAWMRKASAASVQQLAAIAATSTASVAAQLATAADRTARLSAVHELLGSMLATGGGSGGDATNASSDDIDVCSDNEEGEEKRVPATAQPPSMPQPSVNGGGAFIVPYEDSFLAQPPSPTTAAPRQLPSAGAARAPAARPLPPVAVDVPAARQPAPSPGAPTGTLFSADISGIVAAEDSIQPGAMQFYALAGRGGTAAAPQPAAAPAWRPHVQPPQQQLSTIMEGPSALSHSTSAASSASSRSHASVPAIVGGGGGFQIFVDESLAEAGVPQQQVPPPVSRPALAARPVPSVDAENRPARAGSAPLPPSKVAAMLFEPAPRMPHKPAVAVAAKPALAPAPPPAAAAALVAADEDDVTINTRLAINDMDDLFASPSLKRAQARAAGAQPSQRGAEAPAAPIHQSLAAAAVVRQPAAPQQAARPQAPPQPPAAALQPYVDSPPPVDPPPRRAGGRGAARAMSIGGFDLSRIPPDARRLSMAIGVARAPSQSAPVARSDSPLRSPPKSPVRVSVSASGPTGDQTADTGDIANLLGEQPGAAEQDTVDENAPLPGYSNARPALCPATFRAIDPYSVTPLAPGEQTFVTVDDAGGADALGRGYAPARGAERFVLYQDSQFAGNGARLDTDSARF